MAKQGIRILTFFSHFASFLVLSSAYTLPENFFINCGSSSSVTVYGRNFSADKNPTTFRLSAGKSSAVENPSKSDSSILGTYQTARIFKKPSTYELELAQSGIYVVRFHFYPFPSQENLYDSRFDVSASEFSLLYNFSVGKGGNFPIIEEFLLNNRSSGKFRIEFKPRDKSSVAFVNAIEVFLAPDGFISDLVPRVATEQKQNDDYKISALHVVQRINVGGDKIVPKNDSLLRSWIPDDDYLFKKETAKRSEFYSGRPNYKDRNGMASEYIAPDFVYKTAKEMNINWSSWSNFNISWKFDVKKHTTHLLRVHFCDVISKSSNEKLKFDLFIYNNFNKEIYPYRDISSELAVPFYNDFVVDSDESGKMNISIGPLEDSDPKTAFLNGVEIMELLDLEEKKKKKRNLPVIIGSVVGGSVVILILVVISLFCVKKKKAKPLDNFDLALGPLYGGSSYSRTTEGTANGSPLVGLNLGLKLTLSEILHATNNFDTKFLIGEGGFGKVYKGTLSNGMKVAVKRSHPGHGQGLPEFETEITVLSRIRYRHLVSLIGYCDERGEMIVVYEFMEKGTLRDHLYVMDRDSRKSIFQTGELSWDKRLEICIGAAKGLHYLHTGSSGAIIHRDIKSTNILLDENWVAKVADFGLSRSGPHDQTHVSTEVKGTFGYLDPEYFRCLQLTQKSDVYSFGIVLLEVLCARPAVNNRLPRDQVNLADWVMSWQKKGQLEKIIDPSLKGIINMNSLRRFGETVEKCLQECGADRPNMVDVLWDLEYALKLQHASMPRQPHEDSTTDVSLDLPLPVVHRLPSFSFHDNEDEQPLELESSSDESHMNISEVFSQMKIKDAR